MNNQKISKNLSLLAIVLVVQCLLAIILLVKPDAQSSFKPEPLLKMAKNSIDRLVLSGDKSITLERKNNQWLMGDIPADPVKVDMLLDKLTGLETAWPVATSADAVKRFEVADDKFQRKVEVSANGAAVGTLYFGTSPAFNHTHVRTEGKNDVYSLAINSQDILLTQDAWLNTNIMQPPGELKTIRSGAAEIEKSGDTWRLKSDKPIVTEADKAPSAESPIGSEANAGSDTKTNLDAKAIANTFTQMNVLSVADNKAELDAVPETERVNIDVVTSTTTVQYQVIQLKEQYYLKRNDVVHPYRIAKSTYDELIKLANYAREQPKS